MKRYTTLKNHLFVKNEYVNLHNHNSVEIYSRDSLIKINIYICFNRIIKHPTNQIHETDIPTSKVSTRPVTKRNLINKILVKTASRGEIINAIFSIIARKSP